ncbi:MAG: gliding motility lipoprotein GldH [Cytophagales bacterium]|nr:gliding motility lipoprotein GldH [Bernardetiaceae bacterium]MDW8209611.1 gliding motility lipoprotein GldH [Cytophagales bacterium]
MVKFYHLLVVMGLIVSACGDAIFEARRDLATGYWFRNDSLHFEFLVTDTLPSYAIKCAVRYTPAYPYYNLYLYYQLKDKKGTLLQQGMKETYLFDPQDGTPQGKGTGNLYEKEFALLPSFRFGKQGSYILSLVQYMRPDTLRHLGSVSVSIQPAK